MPTSISKKNPSIKTFNLTLPRICTATFLKVLNVCVLCIKHETVPINEVSASRPGRSKGLLYKHLRDSLIDSLIECADDLSDALGKG